MSRHSFQDIQRSSQDKTEVTKDTSSSARGNSDFIPNLDRNKHPKVVEFDVTDLPKSDQFVKNVGFQENEKYFDPMPSDPPTVTLEVIQWLKQMATLEVEMPDEKPVSDSPKVISKISIMCII